MEELLVALACISSKGCPNTVHLYYVNNPRVEQTLNQDTAKASKYLNYDVVVVAPIVFIAAGGSSSIRLNKYFSIDMSRNDKIFSFKLDF